MKRSSIVRRQVAPGRGSGVRTLLLESDGFIVTQMSHISLVRGDSSRRNVRRR